MHIEVFIYFTAINASLFDGVVFHCIENVLCLLCVVNLFFHEFTVSHSSGVAPYCSGVVRFPNDYIG